MNQIDKEKGKLKQDIINLAVKAVKKKTYKFKYIDKKRSEGFADIFDTIINEINSDVSQNGFTLEYIREEKRSVTTHYNYFAVYTVTVFIASDADKLVGKTNRSRAKSGEDFSW